MLCQVCNKNLAVREVTLHRNGIKTTLNLCNECHRKVCVSSQREIDVMIEEQGKNAVVCKKCGTTLNEFLKSGYVGCGKCYEIFSDDVTKGLIDIQAGIKHTGKRPVKAAPTLAGEYERLDGELKKAVAAEDYTRAAEIKKKMLELRDSQREVRL